VRGRGFLEAWWVGVVIPACAATLLSAESAVVPPEQAIAAAVAERLGVAVAIAVLDLETDVAPQEGLVAEPDPSARLARRARFVLSANGARRGLAVATVTAEGRYPRAARAVARDHVIGLDAVDFSDGPLPDLPIRRLLRDDEVVGRHARRNIAAGEPLTPAVLRVPPLVRSGDDVTVTVRIGVVEVVGTGTASGSGQVGETIRVRQPHSSRLLSGRITGPGAVEIEP
jgi:flagellar basal body P-ring formation protein FlgA